MLTLSESISNFTPKSREIYDPVKQFAPENLYEHINGRAEFERVDDVIGMAFANFMKDSLNGPFIDLFIYDDE